MSALLAACVHGAGSRLLAERNARKRMAALQAQAATGGTAIVTIELAAENDVPAAIPLAAPEALETVAEAAAAPETPAAPGGAVAQETLLSLREENEEFVGWLRLPGTQVDYPVMQSPDRPHYYLKRGFYGERVKCGLPFIDESCDLAGNRAHLIVYGHNMKDGSMFGELKRLLDPDFYETHRALTFDTPEASLSYRTVSVYLTELDPDAAFKFYRYPNLVTETDFSVYAENVLSRSVHEADTALSFGDALITLVTCSNHAEEGRLIVVAKRI